MKKRGLGPMDKLSLESNMSFALQSAVFELNGGYSMARKSKKDICKTIRKVRTALELTQEQFAARVGVTVSTVNRWENGKGKPSPLAMRQIEKLQQKINRSK